MSNILTVQDDLCKKLIDVIYEFSQANPDLYLESIDLMMQTTESGRKENVGVITKIVVQRRGV